MANFSQRRVSGPSPAALSASSSSPVSSSKRAFPLNSVSPPSLNTNVENTRIPSGSQMPSVVTPQSAQAGNLGKSGQFIERLQSENASLRRELNFEKAAREEAQKGMTALKGAQNKVREDNERLQLLQATSDRTTERKNRKIEELQAALEAETQRRKTAEAQQQQMATALEQKHQETSQIIAEALTAQKYAEAQEAALRDGMQRLQTRYGQQVLHIRKDLLALITERQEDQSKMKSLDASMQSQRVLLLAQDETIASMQATMMQYEEERKELFSMLEQQAADFRSRAEERDAKGEAMVKELVDTRDKMKWVMANHARQQEEQPKRKKEKR
jgi:hypothetical protein